jgi:hypothetical protein
MIESAPAGFLTQKAAARLLGVSTSFLRESSCPRLLVPGNGRAGKPLLRHSRIAVLTWAGVPDSTTADDKAGRATPRQEQA